MVYLLFSLRCALFIEDSIHYMQILLIYSCFVKLEKGFFFLTPLKDVLLFSISCALLQVLKTHHNNKEVFCVKFRSIVDSIDFCIHTQGC